MASQVITLYKTVSELISWSTSFSRDLPDDTSLSAFETSFIEAFDYAGTDRESTIIANQVISGMSMQFDIQAGVDGEEYTIRIVASGATTGDLKEKIIRLMVRDNIPGGL